MRQRLLVLVGIVSLAAAMLVVISGSQAEALIPSSQLVSVACSDLAQAARGAAADVVSGRWFAAEPFSFTQIPSSTLFANNGVIQGGQATSAECREMGINTQVARIFSKGDSAVLKADGTAAGRITASNQQLYANSALAANSPSYSIERRYAWARAVVINANAGFAIVPGGLAEDLNRIQSCLNGKIATNQGNKVAGVALDCSDEAVRRAVADVIAPGFYLAFRVQPAVNLSCDDLKKQAETGATVEARWAAAKAFVFDGACTPKTVDSLTAVATNGGSAELRFAAIAPLASLPDNAGGSSGVALADAWAKGLSLANGPQPAVGADASCNPTAAGLGNLESYALANAGSAAAATAIAPLARFYTADIALPVGGGGCQFSLGAVEEIRLTVEQQVPGAQFPLKSYVLSK